MGLLTQRYLGRTSGVERAHPTTHARRTSEVILKPQEVNSFVNPFFLGSAAGNVPENVGLREFVESTAKKNGLKLYIDWHSYSQLLMYRKYFYAIIWATSNLYLAYGYSCSEPNKKSTEFNNIAKGAVAAIKAAFGTTFQYGPICQTIYQVSGGSCDYVNDVVKADYTFTLELRDTGRYGFVLPPAQIKPSAIETFEGVKYILQSLK